jgi:hypothetical protein
MKMHICSGCTIIGEFLFLGPSKKGQNTKKQQQQPQQEYSELDLDSDSNSVPDLVEWRHRPPKQRDFIVSKFVLKHPYSSMWLNLFAGSNNNT